MREDNYKDIDYSTYRGGAEETMDRGREVSQASGMRLTMNRVYNWMFSGLILSALTAFGATFSMDLLNVIISAFWVFAIAEIALVIILSAALRKLSYTAAGVMFCVYAVLNGLTLAPILLVYTGTSVFIAFAVCALMFGGASVFSYMVNMDLSKIGSILIMALWGVIIATVVNFFLRSPGLDYILSYICVVIFVGLTAYDTQKIKAMATEFAELSEEEGMKKLAIIGALNLYLDFINLFISLVRIMGRRR